MKAGKKLAKAFAEMSGITGGIALALEKRKVPSRATLYEWAIKLARASAILEEITTGGKQ